MAKVRVQEGVRVTYAASHGLLVLLEVCLACALLGVVGVWLDGQTYSIGSLGDISLGLDESITVRCLHCIPCCSGCGHLRSL